MNFARSAHPAPAPTRVSGDELRFSLTRIVVAWGFGSMFFVTLSGAVYTVWVRKLSTDDRIFGALAAALPFMSFLQVIAARRIERHRKRKWTMIINHGIARTLWLVAALAPLSYIYFPQTFSRPAVFNFVLMCIGTASVFQALAGPSFFSWMADLVPERLRATFFANRLQVGTATAIAVTLVGGLLADKYPRQDVLCWILAAAALAGLVDVAMFIGVPEPAMAQHRDEDGAVKSQPPLLESLREPLRDPTVRTFIVFTSLTMASVGLMGPFMWLHSLENLELSKTVTGLIANVAPLLGMAWNMGFWRNLIDSYGTRPVMRICAVGLILVPAGWIFAQPDEWAGIALIGFLSGSMFGGLELSNQTLLTRIAPQFPRPTIIALFSIGAGVSLALASIAGGYLAQFMRGYEWSIFGFAIMNYHVLFLCAMLLRVLNAFTVAPRLIEPASTPTLETVKDVIPELAQSFADLLTRPLAKSGK